MNTFAKLAIGAAVVLGSSCAYHSKPIPLEGHPNNFAALAGTWAGEYQGEGPLGRKGTIRFTVEPAEEHAHGDVFMTPLGATAPYERYRAGEPTTVPRDAPETSQALTIQFVRVEDGQVKGTLEAYWDPDRECDAYTTFVGRINGDRIEGTFKTTFARPAADVTGQWVVTRKKKQ